MKFVRDFSGNNLFKSFLFEPHFFHLIISIFELVCEYVCQQERQDAKACEITTLTVLCPTPGNSSSSFRYLELHHYICLTIFWIIHKLLSTFGEQDHDLIWYVDF